MPSRSSTITSNNKNITPILDHNKQQNHKAYILVKCKPGFEESVSDALRKLDGVINVEQVYGTPYDIIVKVACSTHKKFSSLVWTIRRADDIASTQTMLVIGTS